MGGSRGEKRHGGEAPTHPSPETHILNPRGSCCCSLPVRRAQCALTGWQVGVGAQTRARHDLLLESN